ncbi:MAG: sel1 repeat family protein [Kofleriaceae bacterium]|nr:sel1 repeat family protein [Kofleriaceae bacterium]
MTLGEHYREGLVGKGGAVLVRRDLRAARRCLERAAALGDTDGMSSLASLLADERPTASTLKRAAALYRTAYRNGNTTAAYNLAVLHKRHGRHRLAVAWFERAYRAGDPSALLQLGLAELYGVGTPRNGAAGIAKLEAMANSTTKYWPRSTGENVEAMLVLADTLMRGWLVPRDYETAIAWLQRAASWDNATAKTILREHGYL